MLDRVARRPPHRVGWPGRRRSCGLDRLWQEARTPWVAVVHAGPQYAGMVQMLTAAGVPTFSSDDRALRILAAYVRALGIKAHH